MSLMVEDQLENNRSEEGVSQSNLEKKKKKPRRKAIQDLEDNLKILKRRRREIWSILISMFQLAIDLAEKGEEILLISKAVRRKGNHSYSYVDELFIELSKNSFLKPHDEYKDGKVARLKRMLHDVLVRDIEIWNELDKLQAVSESERGDIKKLTECLDKLDGFTNVIVWV